MSSPARGTWIEMCYSCPLRIFRPVVPRKGDVDRNLDVDMVYKEEIDVVPRKGDVDRNPALWPSGP